MPKFHENSSWENNQQCGFILFLNMNIVTNNFANHLAKLSLLSFKVYFFLYLVIKEMSIRTQCQ